jgi:2-C-methyl-D-erythritol 4-phosphate cytidylyltransferase/2-C-methyl-D-erythritol 2,4-cyclodiphosphate synthase
MAERTDISAAEAMCRIAAVIVAAGRGERAGQADGPKQYRHIGGRAVIAHTLETFLSHPQVDTVVVAIHADDRELLRKAAEACHHRRADTAGIGAAGPSGSA